MQHKVSSAGFFKFFYCNPFLNFRYSKWCVYFLYPYEIPKYISRLSLLSHFPKLPSPWYHPLDYLSCRVLVATLHIDFSRYILFSPNQQWNIFITTLFHFSSAFLCVIPLMVKTNNKQKDPNTLSKPKFPYLLMVEQFFVRAVFCDSQCHGTREESLRHVSNAAVRNNSLIHQDGCECGESIIFQTAHPMYSLNIFHWH